MPGKEHVTQAWPISALNLPNHSNWFRAITCDSGWTNQSHPRIYVGIIEKRLVFLTARPEPDHMYDWRLGSHTSSFSE